MKSSLPQTISKREESSVIQGLETIYFDEFEDKRGRIWTPFENDYTHYQFITDKVTVSKKHVLRGFHGDSHITKYITCLNGSFQFAALDLRKNSSTYGNTISFIVKDTSPMAIVVPAGVVNAHLSLTDNCVFFYKWSGKYSGPENQVTISYKDPEIGIDWAVEDPIVSDRDRNGIPFRGIEL
jgi:dTDP-4-dehydrorhamnose 3,5-epimerase